MFLITRLVMQEELIKDEFNKPYAHERLVKNEAIKIDKLK